MTPPGTDHDRGSASAELALLTPVLILIAMLTLLASRLVSATMAADDAAHTAARAATLERTPAAAHSAAEAAVENALRTHTLSCASWELHLQTAGMAPGSTVEATLTCQADLADLTGLGVPGARTVHGSATSVVDTYRGQALGPVSVELVEISPREAGAL